MHENDPLAALKPQMIKAGPCPSTEDLVAFSNRSLPIEETLVIRRHVQQCGLCDWALAQLKDFDAATKQAERRLFALPLRLFRRPSLAVAYLLVVLLLYPAYLGIFQTPEVVYRRLPQATAKPPAAESMNSAPLVDLGDATVKRGSASSAAAIPEVALPTNAKYLVLRFYLPVHPDHVYRMQLHRADSDRMVESVEIRSQDPLGNFSVVAPARLFRQIGDYVVVVQEMEQGAGNPLDQYEFRLRIGSHTN